MKLRVTNADKKTIQKLLDALQAAGIHNPAKWIQLERQKLALRRFDPL